MKIHTILVVVLLSIGCLAESAMPKPGLREPRFAKTESKTIIGSIADVSAVYENEKPVTIIHILDFSTDQGFGEPKLSQVLLCGNQSEKIEPHTDISLTYNPASPSALTGCLSLLSAEPWQDNSRWQTVTWDKTKVKRSSDLEKFIQRTIGNPTK
jgi:hypothetical protein